MINYFSSMDFCMVCNAYDTIQTYASYNGKSIHVCEKCAKEKNDKELILAYMQKYGLASPRRAKADGRGARHE